jgi:hypothetical protein
VVVVAAAATIVVYNSNLTESLHLFHIFKRTYVPHSRRKNNDISSNLKNVGLGGVVIYDTVI